MKRKISIIGIGAGAVAGMTVEATKCIRRSDLLIGAARMLEQMPEGKDTWVSYRPAEIGDYVRSHPEYNSPCILMSGDVGFYSGAKRLLAELNDFEVQLVPGISSVQYFAASLQMPWEDWKLMSLHGKEQNLIAAVKRKNRTFAILGGAENLQGICRKLCRYGMQDVVLYIGERLSYPEERITHIRADELTEEMTDALDNLLVVLFENPNPLAMYGMEIPDDAFIRGKVPMTKSEVRTVSISKLRLTEDAVLYDIGAGTGSVSIQAAAVCPDIRICAVEKKQEAVELIRRNVELFAADSVQVVEGTAPECLEDLPMPTHIFIGGSTGNMEGILDAVWAKNPKARVVINAIALETVAKVLELLKQRELEAEEVVQVSTAKARTLAGYHMMTGQNPVTIIVIQPTYKERADET